MNYVSWLGLLFSQDKTQSINKIYEARGRWIILHALSLLCFFLSVFERKKGKKDKLLELGNISKTTVKSNIYRYEEIL